MVKLYQRLLLMVNTLFQLILLYLLLISKFYLRSFARFPSFSQIQITFIDHWLRLNCYVLGLRKNRLNLRQCSAVLWVNMDTVRVQALLTVLVA
jgi:hypothetical protein